ncbi:MAG: tetratricopeptide repeat protein [Polymorphobacter sp.]|uniref:tetratricopeptide repeat protein n=1 Tax=Polymorphobacter sp. TaxID=1909290 RepID=UPI003A87F37F
MILRVLMLSAMLASGAAAKGDDVLKPQSVRMARIGDAALAKGEASAAIDAYEAAIAADPKNVAAYTGVARSYEVLGLPGKAVRFYREALALNPSDLPALEGQGKALIARGATARAQVNLVRIKALCKDDCTAATRLETALAEASQLAEATPDTPEKAKN